MDIQIATLCDFAADYNGKLVISGTFDTLAARAVPVVHPSCALAMRFCFTPEDAGRHKLSINIINEDGESLDPNNMPIEPEFDVQLPKNVPFLTRNIIMNLQGLRFEEAGIYSIDVGCDGEILVCRCASFRSIKDPTAKLRWHDAAAWCRPAPCQALILTRVPSSPELPPGWGPSSHSKSRLGLTSLSSWRDASPSFRGWRKKSAPGTRRLRSLFSRQT
jgi:hypothetical protein